MRAFLRRVPGWQLLVLLKALVVGGERREAAVAMLLKPANLFQPYTTTSADRYPGELAAVRETVGEPARILSFGCASGEELLTLRRAFPAAAIHGIDINPLAVRTARKRVRGDRAITVTRAADAAAEPPSSYDVVLALAVFRHGALKHAPARCDELIRFADFERTVTGLAAAVRPGGVLVIRHANFRFTDTAAAAGFEAVRTGFGSGSAAGPTPVYGPDDRLLDPSCRDDGVYRRRTQNSR
ncbi:MAG: class I SAM-dependent methyltransferase [Nocardioidaceae bacterium]|nr:class I SAM-dependent methyltransferase [Nocardioidaceae bacterium]